jgi:hypothetical protein
MEWYVFVGLAVVFALAILPCLPYEMQIRLISFFLRDKESKE